MCKRKRKCHVKKNKNDKKTNNAQHIRSYNPYKMYRKTRLQPKTDDDLRISEKDIWYSGFKLSRGFLYSRVYDYLSKNCINRINMILKTSKEMI